MSLLGNQKNWANLITFSRIFGVGIIFYIAPYTTNWMALITIMIYTVVCLTDFLDGYIARKYNAVSDLGKVMDPLADKILVLVFLPLVFMNVVDSFPVFLILAREFAIMGIRVFSAKTGLIIAANHWGKIKTAITLPVCGILMARVTVESVSLPAVLRPLEWMRLWVYGWPDLLITVLVWVMVAVTLISFVDYLVKFLWQHYLRQADGDTASAKKKIYTLLPNTITAINLLMGILSVIAALNSQFHHSVMYLMIGSLLDATDGKLARKLGVYSKFGARLDTNADGVTFGVAPAVYIAMAIYNSDVMASMWIGIGLGLLFYSAVHYRLRRYHQEGHGHYFAGLPSPAGAAIMVLAGISPMITSPYTLIGLCIGLSILMISTIPYPHNSITRHIIGFNGIAKISIVFWFMALAQLIGMPIPDHFHIINLTLILTATYLVTPILVKFSTIPTAD